ncbi:uncharacterized protein LOC122659210 [Telopea speciosissima]|uniref:uncharacterized protein LOC122659210 n=1 Tax=Telopea speciosissima TaxID=54955 RepID=UPI001CC58136|nr:uncharacterized protein LOC122659210 [Telopea speciosissima]
MALFDLEQKGDESVSQFLQHAKSIVVELSAAGHPLRPAAFNLHIYRGLKSNFKAMVSSLLTRTDPISYDDLHAMLLSHEFLHGASLKKLSISDATPAASQPIAHNVQRSTPSGTPGFSSPNQGGRGGHGGRGRGFRGGRGGPNQGYGRF